MILYLFIIHFFLLIVLFGGILYQNMSRTIFSKCFIVLQENENSPLPNVLLLMQCQSAPVKRCSISGGNGGEGDHGNSEH